MAQQITPNYGLSYYEQYDINWHTGINNNFINLDALLANIEQDVLDIGSINFIPHSLWTYDSNADDIPELWTKTDDSCTISATLSASEVMGFANKIQLTISNSSGATKYPEFKISAQIPPNLDITFSAWLKSVNLSLQLRIYDGTSYFDSTLQTEAAVIRRQVSAGGIAAGAATVDLIVRISVPDAATNETVEIHLPMLNTGDKAAGFAPAAGETAQSLINDLYVAGKLKTNLDCNQRQLQQLRLQLRTSDPGAPVRGEIWFDDAAGKKRPRFYDGTLTELVSVAKQTHKWVIAGALSTGAEQGGVWLAPRSLTIEKVYIYCKTTGSAGSSIVDINKNGATIFTTQANRPTLAFDDTDKKAVSGTPDITALAEGDIMSMDIDQIATGAADLSVIIICA